MIAYPGSFAFRAGKRTAPRYTYSPWYPVLQYNATGGLFFGGSVACAGTVYAPSTDQNVEGNIAFTIAPSGVGSTVC